MEKGVFPNIVDPNFNPYNIDSIFMRLKFSSLSIKSLVSLNGIEKISSFRSKQSKILKNKKYKCLRRIKWGK